MVRELKVSVRVDDESMRGIEEAMRASGEGSVSEFVRKSLRLAVLAHASDRRALLDVSPYLVGMIDRYLESGHARRRSLRTYEDLIVYALVNFFQQLRGTVMRLSSGRTPFGSSTRSCSQSAR